MLDMRNQPWPPTGKKLSKNKVIVAKFTQMLTDGRNPLSSRALALKAGTSKIKYCFMILDTIFDDLLKKI